MLIADIDLEGAKKVAAAIGEGASATRLDITSERAWNEALDRAWRTFGGLTS